MDVNATLRTLLDPWSDDDDRIHAGESLIDWLDRGGFEPIDDDGETWSRDDVWTLMCDHGLHSPHEGYDAVTPAW